MLGLVCDSSDSARVAGKQRGYLGLVVCDVSAADTVHEYSGGAVGERVGVDGSYFSFSFSFPFSFSGAGELGGAFAGDGDRLLENLGGSDWLG